MREFGPAFETYVGQVLDELGLEVVRERDLQQRLNGAGKCVDFAVLGERITLLIDSKGIEGHYDELYSHLPAVLTEKLKTTVLHAIDQGVETVNRLPQDLRRPTIVFLCITYKQLNIGDGNALRELTVETPEWNSPRWGNNSLPPTHMLTLSISELELLCGIVKGGSSIDDVVLEIIANNSAPDTRKFFVSQHLAKFGQVDIPDCSRNSARELCGF
jgi:hypothetical protein